MQHPNELSNFSNSVGDPVAALHRLQQLASQRINTAMYGNMMSQPPPPLPAMGIPQMMSDQWYYEDPNVSTLKKISGSFGIEQPGARKIHIAWLIFQKPEHITLIID